MLDATFNTCDLDAGSHPTEAPRRILSVTGGGLLGVIPAAMLVRLEALGVETYGPAYKLCHSFDLVGGTSTGAVIATAVALGLSAEEIAGIYLDDAPNGFRPRRFSIPVLHDRLDEELLRGHFQRRTQERHLCRGDLWCDLTIIVKNICRSVPMAFSTLAAGRTPEMCLGAEMRGDRLPLDRLLRASTAAPGLFRPKMLPVGQNGTSEVCIDGGLSPYNNPALILARVSRGAWAGDLEVTSLGTGSSRPRHSANAVLRKSAMGRMLQGLVSTVVDAGHHMDAAMTDLARMPGSRLRYQAHDLPLTREAIETLGASVSQKELRQMRAFDDIRGKARLFEIAKARADCMIKAPLPLSRQGERVLRPDLRCHHTLSAA